MHYAANLLVVFLLSLACGLPGPAAAKRTKVELPAADEILAREQHLLSGSAPDTNVVYRMHGRISMMGAQHAAMSMRTVPGEWIYMRTVASNGSATDVSILGDLGWEVASNSRPRLLDEQSLAMLQALVLTPARTDWREKYPKRKTIGTGAVHGEDAYKVRLVDADGDESLAWFSVESGLRLTERRVVSFGHGPMSMSVSYGDFRAFEGGMMPFQMVIALENIRTEVTFAECFATSDDPAPPDLPLAVQALLAMQDGQDPEQSTSGHPPARPVVYTALVPPDAAAVRFALGDSGRAAPAVGDLDGDGHADIAFAIHRTSDAKADRVLVFKGPYAGEVDDHGAFARLYGGGASLAGERPLALPDLDGDGDVDLAILWDLGDDGPALCLIHGPIEAEDRGTDACDAWFTLPTGVDTEGALLHAAGDLTGDGIDDVLVGLPARGTVTVLPGRGTRYQGSSGLVAAAMVELAGAGHFGASIAVADADGDGAADLWIAAPDLDDPRVNAGGVFLYRGPIGAASASGEPTSSVHAGLSRIHVGLDLDAGADLDGDGVHELLVLASHPQLGGDAVVLETWPAARQRELAWMTTRVAAIGLTDPLRRARTAGDVDGDGFTDVLIGVPDAEKHAGRAYLLYGPLTHAMTLAEAPILFTSPGPDRRFGSEIYPVGDLDGDGFDDVLITAVGGPSAFLYRGCERPDEISGDAAPTHESTE